MSPEREYSRIYFCHSCDKYLDEAFFNSHKALGHNADSYISMPRNVENRIMPEEEKIDYSKTYVALKDDYADIIDDTEESEGIGE